MSGLSSQAQGIVAHARDSDGYTSSTFVCHRWGQAASECNRSIIGWSAYLCTCTRCCIFRGFTVISALPEHFNPLYLLFNTVGTSGCSYSSEFEHIPALFNALTTHRFQQGLLRLWLNKAGVLNCGKINKTNLQNTVLQAGRNLGFSPTTLR